MDLIAKYEDMVFTGRRFDNLIENIEAATADGIPVHLVKYVIVNKDKILVWLAEYSNSPVSAKVKFDLPQPYRIFDVLNNKDMGVADAGTAPIMISLKNHERAKLLLLSSISGKALPENFKPRIHTVQQAKIDRKGLIFEDCFEGNTQGHNGSDKYYFTYAPSAENHGLCMWLRHYLSWWILDKKLTFKSGAVTIKFRYRPSKMYPNQSSKNPYIITIKTDKNLFVRLHLFSKAGTMRMLAATGKHNYYWERVIYSKKKKWAKDFWYDIKLQIGKEKMALWVNDKLEGENRQGFPVAGIDQISIGHPWASLGSFDDLRIYDGLK